MTLKRLGVAGTVMLAAVLLAGCGKRAEISKPAPPSVTVNSPVEEQVTEYIELTGTVVPSRSVDLVARVTGYLQAARFEDGSFVESGDVLFEIERGPYEQDLKSAEATLRRAQAEFDRQEILRQKNATSTANVEKWLSSLESAKAQVELAKINLEYTRVTAPFSGRVGRRLVDPGNLVGPNVNTKLAKLDQLVPIYVYFNLNERDALRLWATVRQFPVDRRAVIRKKVVEVGVQTDEGYPHRGTLDFVETGVSTSSGAVPMRAVISNEDKVLFPGVFARVRLAIGDPRLMLVVPNSAVGNDQEGDYVLVVDGNDTVIRRPVAKGPMAGKGCAIRSGLTAADRVIVAGLTRAKAGAKVTPVSATAGQTAAADPVR